MTFHYYNQDHLGNNREVVNENGTIEQVTNYYPFGAPYCDNTNTNADLQPYKYNGKELDLTHGLNTYDYGARQYNSIVPSWTSVDPLAEKYYNISPYVYCGNNPVNRIDPDGCDSIYYDQNGSELYRIKNKSTDVIFGIRTKNNVGQFYSSQATSGKVDRISDSDYWKSWSEISEGKINDKNIVCFGNLDQLKAAKEYIKDDGKSGDGNINNCEYLGDFSGNGICNEMTSPIFKSTNVITNVFNIVKFKGRGDWHSHYSGSVKNINGKYVSALQPPSIIDINSCPANTLQYVFGMFSNMIYQYSNKGITSVLPFSVIK